MLFSIKIQTAYGKEKAPVKSHKDEYFPISQGGPSKILQHQDCALFLCWPPYDEPMAYECLQLYQGSHVIYVGESPGGCNACDNFFRLLDKEWQEVKRVSIPQWQTIHDFLVIYSRR